PKWMASMIHVVLVDDASQKYPARGVLKKYSKLPVKIDLYRIKKNIAWNIPVARNLAMDKADDGWILSTDIDLIFPLLSILRLLRKDLNEKWIYRPIRQGECKSIWGAYGKRYHRETLIVTKKMFWEIGGFDEDLTGFWNGAFYPFNKHLKKDFTVQVLDDVRLYDYSEKIRDASTVTWSRSGGEFDIQQNKKMLSLQKNKAQMYAPSVLTQEWEKEQI
ncbi:MAG: glycosyltransferase family 2 protein, partial [Anaerolineaceae bacterium]|nr:glycosyltransferase family 2 protein [Anaerolineaceae bacterium]